jgi:hypothetical protein
MLTSLLYPTTTNRISTYFLIHSTAQADDERGKVLFLCMDAELNRLASTIIMSRKKTPPVAEPTNRPVILGFLILAAGGYSTWYWYKPLPDLTQSVSSSPWGQDRSTEWNWTDSAVLRPTLEELQPSTPNLEVAGSALPVASAFGTAPPPDLPRTTSGLVAAPNIKWQLNTATQLEPPPKSPDIHIPEEAIVGTVKPWVDYDNLSETAVADVDYKWPSKQPTPDEATNGFSNNITPTRATLSTAPLPPSTFGTPPLLDISGRKIAVTDDDGTPPLPRSSSPTEFTVTPPRAPQYIRQPK